MLSALKTRKTVTGAKSKAQYLGFQTVIGTAVYPLAVFKFDGKNAYCWDWLTNSKGYLLLYADFVTGRSGSFGKYEESHISYHESGTRHARIAKNSKKLYLTPLQRTPVSRIQTWESIASVAVPLTGPLSHVMSIREWNRTAKRITLASSDFGGREGIYLRAYLCKKECIRVLKKRYSLGTWVVGSGKICLVIAADPAM